MNVSEKLFELFMELPPKTDEIVRLFNTENCTRECISESFCKYVEECFSEYSDFVEQHGRKPRDEEIHSTYIRPLCELSLKHGLDPNYCFGESCSESNVMYAVYWVDKPYVAADVLKLLLENGGDPLLEVDGESIWQLADFDIMFDVLYGYAQEKDYEEIFDSRFHFWLVLRGFMFADEEEFKDHALFTYNLVQTDQDHWNIQVIRK